MEEQEFRRLLDQFPVVRSRDYRADLDSSRPSISRSYQNQEVDDWHDAWNDGESKGTEDVKQDAFWEKLKVVAQRKVGAAEADKFCAAFQQVHKKLVYEGLSLDAAKRILTSSSARD